MYPNVFFVILHTSMALVLIFSTYKSLIVKPIVPKIVGIVPPHKIRISSPLLQYFITYSSHKNTFQIKVVNLNGFYISFLVPIFYAMNRSEENR
jgi:hypothetical protein